jgi:membrane fusion protein, heavy metal efflux system
MPQVSKRFRCNFATLISSGLSIAISLPVLAHGGHGNEFKGGTTGSTAIKVDAQTAKRMGLKLESVRRRTLAFGVRATGQLESLPNQKVEVTTPVGGTVIKLLVSPGQVVQKGQAVAIMTSPDLAGLRTEALDRRAEAIATVEQAQADQRLAVQNLIRQKTLVAAAISKTQTALDLATERYAKDKSLSDSGAIPRRQVLESKTGLAEARANLAQAESRLPMLEAQAQLERAQSSVAVAQKRVFLSFNTYQTRLRQLDTAPNPDGTITIAAPISGIVANREATLGESGQDAGKKIMTILNGQGIQISANLYEKDIGQVQVGQPVRVKVNGISNSTFAGQVSVIGTGVEGETRIIPVKVLISESNATLKPGMFADLEMLTNRTATLAIPRSAMVETNDKKTVVFVQNGNAFEPTEVSIGRTAGELAEVKGGLFDGDVIVTQRAIQLYAQSLRGGSPKAPEEVNHEEKSITSAPPLWWILPVVGAIAGGTFWAGMAWGSRRNRPQMAYEPNKHDAPEAKVFPHPPISPILTSGSEEYQTPQPLQED